MLALAIGLNVTVFTVMDAMLFRGFPLVKRNDRLVYLQERCSVGRVLHVVRGLRGVAGRRRSRSKGWRSSAGRAITFRDGDGRPIDMRVTFTVSANTFGLLGVPADAGAGLRAGGRSARAPRRWRSSTTAFGRAASASAPDIVGSTVHINGAPATVIGVMPERFDFPTQERTSGCRWSDTA